ncbi:hypothetical protein HF325_003224 [Metschnikowia pulcherrima]|uniref:Pre-mRNA-splicing factor CEF1 n=1 Tax=Metschnikowia pulcherrima TaxID=27326 RepID=A0A8H7GRD3_9ASCO|nr:hypothetical protein HF325_003224 [Metschnikowia pulcherrima]
MAPPIYVKGGVWTNVEDQILKAAVLKYGLTQWLRVASLLPKKTAKQAKARWNEYLNPSIDRSAWTREDDEKLLGVAKLLPNQWRTIALVMGRTATHCVERYQKLLEDAVEGGKDEDAELALAGPGIESMPALGNAFESLVARPDDEIMAEDEREMLSEAKSRLANTQGKKAKRKDRERMLEESRRVALLQKRRELKAAGISVSLTLKNRARRKEFDFNADIPHERQPQPGLYDVLGEDLVNEQAREKFQREVNFKGLDFGVKKDKKSVKDAGKDAQRARANVRLAAEAVLTLDAAQQAKRRKLELPPPGIVPEEDKIGERILEKSRLLLSALNNAPVISRTESLGPSQHPKPLKASRKKVVSALKSLLSKVPAPKASTQLILPTFDPHEEAIAIEASNEDPNNLDQLNLLRQVDEEKANLRRSQSEFRSLVEFDRAQEDDENNTGLDITPIDESLLSLVEKTINEELEKLSRQNVVNGNILEKDPLPTLQDAITRVYDLLCSLDASANEADQKLAILEDTNASGVAHESLRHQILENANALSETVLEETLLKRIAWSENAAIERRSATLHELVEGMKAAERRVSRKGC